MNIPMAWTRTAQDRMESGPYTAFRCSGTWVLHYGKSDPTHYALLLGRFVTPDEAYVAAERDVHRRENS